LSSSLPTPELRSVEENEDRLIEMVAGAIYGSDPLKLSEELGAMGSIARSIAKGKQDDPDIGLLFSMVSDLTTVVTALVYLQSSVNQAFANKPESENKITDK
jgi:hypothetical protein